MAATAPAARPRGGVDPPRVGLSGGLFNARDWEEIRARSRRILRGAADRRKCVEISRRRASEFFGKLEGEIPSIPFGGGSIRSSRPFVGPVSVVLAGSVSGICVDYNGDLDTALVNMEGHSSVVGSSERFQRGVAFLSSDSLETNGFLILGGIE